MVARSVVESVVGLVVGLVGGSLYGDILESLEFRIRFSWSAESNSNIGIFSGAALILKIGMGTVVGSVVESVVGLVVGLVEGLLHGDVLESLEFRICFSWSAESNSNIGICSRAALILKIGMESVDGSVLVELVVELVVGLVERWRSLQ